LGRRAWEIGWHRSDRHLTYDTGAGLIADEVFVITPQGSGGHAVALRLSYLQA